MSCSKRAVRHCLNRSEADALQPIIKKVSHLAKGNNQTQTFPSAWRCESLSRILFCRLKRRYACVTRHPRAQVCRGCSTMPVHNTGVDCFHNVVCFFRPNRVCEGIRFNQLKKSERFLEKHLASGCDRRRLHFKCHQAAAKTNSATKRFAHSGIGNKRTSRQ